MPESQNGECAFHRYPVRDRAPSAGALDVARPVIA
jgi:hypothetical protein